jgi:hypothetical protein
MEADVRTLRQLMRHSMYIVDERAVAEAIILRARFRATVARCSLPNQLGRSRSAAIRRRGRSA